MSPPKDLSILMIAYNHAQFLGKAIQSVLDQQTNFSWELVIGDDASTDGSQEILSRYSKDPRIRVLPASSRLGMSRNFARTLGACSGRYVAFLEGDDYWIDPSKLQRQLTLLESRPDVALCATNALLHRESSGGLEPDFGFTSREERTLVTSDLVWGNPAHTCTYVVRRSAIPEIDADLLRLGMLDFPIWILASRHGSLVKLTQCTGAYRIHDQGVWTSTSARRRIVLTIEALSCIEGRLEDPVIRKAIVRQRHLHWAREIALAAREGDRKDLARRCLRTITAPLSCGLLPRARIQALVALFSCWFGGRASHRPV
jgi:glycosyltransferase involved in cell wall biosynthesis